MRITAPKLAGATRRSRWIFGTLTTAAASIMVPAAPAHADVAAWSLIACAPPDFHAIGISVTGFNQQGTFDIGTWPMTPDMVLHDGKLWDCAWTQTDVNLLWENVSNGITFSANGENPHITRVALPVVVFNREDGYGQVIQFLQGTDDTTEITADGPTYFCFWQDYYQFTC